MGSSFRAFLALSGALATYSGNGPSNFVATPLTSPNGFANIKLTWTPANCPMFTPVYNIRLTSIGQPERLVGQTRSTEFTITDAEYWTKYTIRLETLQCWNAPSVLLTFSTGPGAPHTVSKVVVSPSAFGATFTITEPRMPRTVNRYTFVFCRMASGSCRNTSLIRNPNFSKTVEVEDLVPASRYTLEVRSHIDTERTTYTGESFKTAFTTDNYKYPTVYSLRQRPTKSTERAGVTVSWKMESHNEVRPEHYKATLRDGLSQKTVTRTLYETSANFVNIPWFVRFDLTITPVFRFADEYVDGPAKTMTFWTATEEIGPPQNFEIAQLAPTTTQIGWDAPADMNESNLTYHIAYCSVFSCATDTKMATTKSTRWILSPLIPKGMYVVNVTAVAEDDTKQYRGKTLTSTFTATYDASQIVDLRSDFLFSSRDGATYNISWGLNGTREPEWYDIIMKNSAGVKVETQKGEKSKLVKLDYFERYVIEVKAHFRTSMGRLQISSSKTKLDTPGMAPANVTNASASAVTSTSATLTWSRPSNLPASVNRTYLIVVRDTGIHQRTSGERVVLNGLAPYRAHEVSIRTEAVYKDVPYISEESFVSFTTDVGVPGAVQELNVTPTSASHLLHVTWSAPAVGDKNGPIDFYIVRAYDERGQRISQTYVVAATATDMAIPSLGRAKYTIEVCAVNVNRNKELLQGREVTAVVTVH